LFLLAPIAIQFPSEEIKVLLKRLEISIVVDLAIHLNVPKLLNGRSTSSRNKNSSATAVTGHGHGKAKTITW
jgi:hypothetical protein